MAGIYTLIWFENVCVELSRNPKAATQALSDFQDSDNAVEMSMSFVEMTNNPPVQFQAISTLQYACMKRWSSISEMHKTQIRAVLWNFVAKPREIVLVTYVQNKIIQLLALTWKRSWALDNETTKNSCFAQILSSVNDAWGIRLSAAVLRALVEEFSNEKRADTHMSMEHHRQAYKAFTASGIDNVFSSTLDMLAQIFHALQTANRQKGLDGLLDVIASIAEVSKLLSETLQWNFSSSDVTILLGANMTANIILDLPKAWATPLLQSPLIAAVFDAYNFIRQLFYSTATSLTSHQVTIVMAALTELRHNIVCLSSVSSTGKLLATGGEGSSQAAVQYGDAILSRLVPLLNQMLPNLEEGSTSGAHQAISDLHDQECEGLSVAMLRFVGNFKLSTISRMQAFEEMVLALARCCHALAHAMASAAECRYRAVIAGAASTHPLLVDAEGGLLESRWGDVLTLLLEAWGLVLDDPLLLGQYGQLSSMQSEGQTVSSSLRSALHGITSQVFASLFECILKVELSDTLCDEQGGAIGGEILQEHEDIGSRSRDDLLQAIGTVGRACFGSALRIVLGRMLPVSDALQTCTPSAPSPIEQLETLRVCSVLSSHICLDSFTSTSGTKSSEVPVIPPRVVDSLTPANSGVKQSLVQLVFVHIRLVRYQVDALQSRPAASSPLVVQTCLRFLSQYFRAYLDPDPSLYPTGAMQAFSNAFKLHSANEFSGVLSELLNCCHGLLVALPLEEGVVEGVADLLEAFGARPTFANIVASSKDTMLLLQHVGTDRYNLSSAGLAHVWRGVATLLVRGGRSDLLEQVCESILQMFGDRDHFGLLRMVSTLTGLARCPPIDCLSKDVSNLFDRCVPHLLSALPLSDADPNLALLALLTLHRDYSEIHVPALSTNSIGRLCDSTLLLIRLVGDRLAAIASSFSRGDSTDEHEQSFYSEALLTCLQMLNHLATTEFSNDYMTPAESAAVTNTLFSSVSIIAPFLSPNILRMQPSLQDPYFSFLAYLLNSYSDWWLRLQTSNMNLLAGIIGQCVWVVGALDGPVARMALEVLYVVVAQQVNAVSGAGNTVVLPNDCLSLLSDALSRLLEILLYPATSETRGVAHKTDAFGHALAALIAFDGKRFRDVVNEVLTRQAPAQRTQLTDCFQRLVTARGLQLGALSKPQRHLFVLNLRDFVMEISSLSLLR